MVEGGKKEDMRKKEKERCKSVVNRQEVRPLEQKTGGNWGIAFRRDLPDVEMICSAILPGP